MIQRGAYHSGVPYEAVLAHMIMSKDSSDTAMKKGFESGVSGRTTGALFLPDELDIYVNKVTLEAYIFHSKEIDYSSIVRLEYNPKDHGVDVVKADGTRMDLGVRIQWLVRPYFTKAEEINIVQTKDGHSVNGKVVPLLHKGKK